MRGQPELFQALDVLGITFEYFEHPPVRTVEDMDLYSKEWHSTRCKNLFFRNHKGDKHFLVIAPHDKPVVISELEERLKQGKLSLASSWRLEKYLGLQPGAVSPFGLINDKENHVFVFIDEKLKTAEFLTFHPNVNDATLKISGKDFISFLDWSGNSYCFI